MTQRRSRPGTRRRAVSSAVAAAVVVLVLVVAALAAYVAVVLPSQSTTSSTGASLTTSFTRTGNGSLLVGTVGQLGATLDPAYAIEPLALNMIHNLGSGLVGYAPSTGEVVPALALSWNSSAGGSVWTFDLRHGVAFPDGSPFNASVEVDTYGRADDIGAGTYAGQGLNSLIKNVTATGTYQVQFVLNHPSSVDFAADVSLYPVDPALGASGNIINYTGVPATENPLGLGPYLLSGWVKSGGKDVAVSLSANPGYWNASGGLPVTKTVEVRFYADSSTMLSDLSRGNLDLAYADAAFGGIQSGALQPFTNSPDFTVWKGPAALGISTVAVARAGVRGVVLDSSDVFRYYLVTTGT